MILGRLWYSTYDPDISWKDGSYLRPCKREYLANSMGSVDDGLYGYRTKGRVYFKDPLYETVSDKRSATNSGRSGSYYGRKEGRVIKKLPPEDSLGQLGIGRQQKIRTDAEVAVISINEYGKFEFVERVAILEAVYIAIREDGTLY